MYSVRLTSPSSCLAHLLGLESCVCVCSVGRLTFNTSPHPCDIQPGFRHTIDPSNGTRTPLTAGLLHGYHELLIVETICFFAAVLV